MKNPSNPINALPPRRWHTALELPRALLEMATLPLALPSLARAPRGDGHPVLLAPGFMANESSLLALRWYLALRGYAVHTWGQGRNVGLRAKDTDAFDQTLERLNERYGRKVSIIGWSLGGVFGLCAARTAPERVRSLITLGSPITPSHGGSKSARAVLALYRVMNYPEGPEVHLGRASVQAAVTSPPALPISCLYSHSDGVVPVHEACIASTAPQHENIAVPGSHTGLGFNPMVLWIVADRLAQPEHHWQRFDPSGAAGAAYHAALAAG